MPNYNVRMKKNSIAIISRIRENSSKFLTKKLEENGIKGVVPSHGDIMAELFKTEKCTMKELSEKIHRTKSTVTTLVEKLLELGFVEKEKSAKDCRITYIKLTTRGKSLKPAFIKISEELNAKVYKNFSTEEADLLEQLLEKLNQNLR